MVRGKLNEAHKYLKLSQELLEECEMINDTLEGILENSPKPSECIDWFGRVARN
jgi:hypothetical protein